MKTQTGTNNNKIQERLTWPLDDLAKAIGISKSLIRLEIARGNLKAIKVGKRRVVIPVAEVARYLSGEK